MGNFFSSAIILKRSNFLFPVVGRIWHFAPSWLLLCRHSTREESDYNTAWFLLNLWENCRPRWGHFFSKNGSPPRFLFGKKVQIFLALVDFFHLSRHSPRIFHLMATKALLSLTMVVEVGVSITVIEWKCTIMMIIGHSGRAQHLMRLWDWIPSAVGFFLFTFFLLSFTTRVLNQAPQGVTSLSVMWKLSKNGYLALLPGVKLAQ